MGREPGCKVDENSTKAEEGVDGSDGIPNMREPGVEFCNGCVIFCKRNNTKWWESPGNEREPGVVSHGM